MSRLAQTSRLRIERLEDRATPSASSFSAALGGGPSAVLLDVTVTAPTGDFPEIVAVSRMLPNGRVVEAPRQPIAPPNPIAPPVPIRELLPPGPLRGWFQAADISSNELIIRGGGST